MSLSSEKPSEPKNIFLFLSIQRVRFSSTSYSVGMAVAKGHFTVPVHVYNEDGSFLKTFSSITGAVKELVLDGNDVSQMCRGALKRPTIRGTGGVRYSVKSVEEPRDLHVSELPNSRWKQYLPDHPYEVSNQGQLRNGETGYIYNQHASGEYLCVTLVINGESVRCNVHPIVCRIWNGPPPGEGFDVNHLDWNKHNNAAENLEWSTRQDNILHGWRNPARKCSFAKPVQQFDLQTSVILGRWPSAAEAARSLGLDPANIGRTCRGEQRAYKGMGWRFDE